ncbi:hypothetical protein ABPG75_008710 [Micractinium tetrahymenae]
MVLLVGGQPVAAAALLSHPEVQAAAEMFLQQPADIPLGDKIIYACQGEEATCAADEAAWLSSSDATTCINAIVVAAPDLASSADTAGAPGAAKDSCTSAAGSGLARVMHHDEGTGVDATLAGLSCSTARLWLAGGYDDAGGMGRAVTTRLLRCLERRAARLHVELACLGALNTAPDGSPCTTALAVDLHSLRARPAAPHPPERRGPLLLARMAQWAYAAARSSSSGGGPDGGEQAEDGERRPLRRAYDAAARQMELELWQGRPAPDVLWYVGRMLQLPDDQLLQRWSTSPAHEPPHFVADMRAACNWLLQQIGPEQLVTHRFAWTPGSWLPAAEGKSAAAAGQDAQPAHSAQLEEVQQAAGQAAAASPGRLCRCLL